ncbi:MAG: hypothetical protein WA708_14885 [Acidobacteriaceae bacterium]
MGTPIVFAAAGIGHLPEGGTGLRLLPQSLIASAQSGVQMSLQFLQLRLFLADNRQFRPQKVSYFSTCVSMLILKNEKFTNLLQ